MSSLSKAILVSSLALVVAGCRFFGTADNASCAKESCAFTCPSELIMLEMQIDRDGKTLAKPGIATRLGQEGEYKKVTEYIYPTHYNVVVTGTNGVFAATVEPQDFTMREVGVVVTATPTQVDGRINVDVKVEIVDEPTWKNYGGTMTASNGVKSEMPMEQPFFPVQSVKGRYPLLPGKPTTIQSDGLRVTITPKISSSERVSSDGKREIDKTRTMR